MAPVSTYNKPSSSATRRATVLFPEPAGPSMAMEIFFSMGKHYPYRSLFSLLRGGKVPTTNYTFHFFAENRGSPSFLKKDHCFFLPGTDRTILFPLLLHH